MQTFKDSKYRADEKGWDTLALIRAGRCGEESVLFNGMRSQASGHRAFFLNTLLTGDRKFKHGVQATKTFAKIKGIIHAALAKVEEVVKGAVKIIARLTYRQRYEQSTGRDPLRCPHWAGP